MFIVTNPSLFSTHFKKKISQLYIIHTHTQTHTVNAFKKNKQRKKLKREGEMGKKMKLILGFLARIYMHVFFFLPFLTIFFLHYLVSDMNTYLINSLFNQLTNMDEKNRNEEKLLVLFVRMIIIISGFFFFYFCFNVNASF